MSDARSLTPFSVQHLYILILTFTNVFFFLYLLLFILVLIFFFAVNRIKISLLKFSLFVQVSWTQDVCVIAVHHDRLFIVSKSNHFIVSCRLNFTFFVPKHVNRLYTLQYSAKLIVKMCSFYSFIFHFFFSSNSSSSCENSKLSLKILKTDIFFCHNLRS